MTIELVVYGKGWLDRLVGFVISITLVFLIVFLAWFGFIVANETLLQTAGTEIKAVASRGYVPEHFQPVVVSSGKVTTVMMVYIPDSYSLCFDFRTNSACANVSKNFWDQSEPGTMRTVEYGYGRLNGKYVIKSIR